MAPGSTIPPSVRRGLLRAALIAAAATFASVGAASDADRTLDAACAWGRLADGRGRLVRCLTSAEAARLRSAGAVPAPAPSAIVGGVVPSAIPPAVPASRPPSAPPQGEPVPVAPDPAPAPTLSESGTASPDPGSTVSGNGLSAELGPVIVDEGALPEALKGLRKARDRYAECVDRNGGLSAERGEVELRFLVQGKGRAEGVSVKKRRGLGEAAARCVAGVVDRRYVGYPEVPATGAAVVVTVMKKKQ